MPAPPEDLTAVAPVILALVAVIGLAAYAGIRSAGARPFLQRAAGGVLGALLVVALALIAQALLARSLGDALLGLYLLLIGPGLSALVAAGVLAVEVVTRRGVSGSGLVRTVAASSLAALAWLLGYPLMFGRSTAAVVLGWALAFLAVAACAAAAHGMGRRRG